MDQQSAVLLTHIPRYDHIITSKLYNGSLARKHILEHPSRSKLSDMISSLDTSRDGVHNMLQRIQVGRDGDANEVYAPLFANADATLEGAHCAAAVVAAVNTVEGFKGSAKGRDMASLLLQRSASALPDALRKIVEGMVRARRRTCAHSVRSPPKVKHIESQLES